MNHSDHENGPVTAETVQTLTDMEIAAVTGGAAGEGTGIYAAGEGTGLYAAGEGTGLYAAGEGTG